MMESCEQVDAGLQKRAEPQKQKHVDSQKEIMTLV
jgi:hypothetical protein